MNKYNEVMKKVQNKEPIKAVHYVKLEHDSDKCRARIMKGNGTKLCRDFLKENQNISLVEAPYIDCEFSTRNLGNRVGFANLYMRLGCGDIDVILVDDIHEICSSFADTLTTVQMYDNLGAIIYDIKGEQYIQGIQLGVGDETKYYRCVADKWKIEPSKTTE